MYFVRLFYFNEIFFYRCDFSLNYEIVYYVLSPDYNIYMDKQQEINLGIMKAFEKEKIEFAYPTQQLFLTHQNKIS